MQWIAPHLSETRRGHSRYVLSSVPFFLIPPYCNPSRIGFTVSRLPAQVERRVSRAPLSRTILPKLRPIFHRRVSLVVSLPSLFSDRVPKLAMYLTDVSSSISGYRKAPLLRLSIWRYSKRGASKRGTRSADLANTSGASTRVTSHGEKLPRHPESRRLDAIARCCEDDARPVVHGEPDMVPMT